ncbi:MAG: hypothetical protein HQK62_07355 [Desulfamplus sp.]|nr:hypothetical protein [Desulfamplus sp.]
MLFGNRIRKLEKKDFGKDGAIKIKVNRLGHEEWAQHKQLFESRKKLGLLTLKEIRSQIFVSVGGSEQNEDITEDDARKLLKKNGESHQTE